MLTVKYIERLGRPAFEAQASVVIVEDDLGNPIVAICELQPNVTTVVDAKDPRFNEILSALGLDKVVLCTELRPSNQVPEGAKLINGPNIALLQN